MDTDRAASAAELSRLVRRVIDAPPQEMGGRVGDLCAAIVAQGITPRVSEIAEAISLGRIEGFGGWRATLWSGITAHWAR